MLFSEYMHEWLYGENGYYATYKNIGKAGDFYTAVSTSKFFGGAIARHIIEQIEANKLKPNSTICEIGAHHGYLLADIIEFIYTLKPELLKTLKFAIIERFEKLREFQKNYFLESFGDAISLEQYSSLDEFRCESAFFIANEIFDAFSCELYYKGKIARVLEHEVVFDVADEHIEALAKKYHKDRGEIAVGYDEFAKSLVACAKEFEFMSFDYGEMMARPDFSIRVYAKHRVEPFFEPSLDKKELFAKSDITYDVTFEHVKDAFLEAGAVFLEFKAQMVALVDMGILELLEILKEKSSQEIYEQELQKVKMLIMPNFLGERFKMIRFSNRKG